MGPLRPSFDDEALLLGHCDENGHALLCEQVSAGEVERLKVWKVLEHIICLPGPCLKLLGA